MRPIISIKIGHPRNTLRCSTPNLLYYVIIYSRIVSETVYRNSPSDSLVLPMEDGLGIIWKLFTLRRRGSDVKLLSDRLDHGKTKTMTLGN